MCADSKWPLKAVVNEKEERKMLRLTVTTPPKPNLIQRTGSVAAATYRFLLQWDTLENFFCVEIHLSLATFIETNRP
jgi:hypothetical protein